MMSRTKCLIFLLVTLLSLPVVAQKGQSTKKQTPKADNAYNQANYIRATELYKKCYAKQKSAPEKLISPSKPVNLIV
ncbi:MAG: hypothetical protein IPI23_10600 [Bacteroidetes bacterium]|nr:hypothetical protein [Bacteroidota bacterium]